MAHGAVRLLAATLALGIAALPGAVRAAPKNPPTGALAYHRDSGSFGYAVNARDSRSARIAALKQCGHPKCEIVASLSKDCGAVANGPKKFVASRGATRQEAEARALRLCGESCEVVGWACPR
ncbi:MAG: DUF4189 domain-containing protein [Proteobacteria bacterium]|nr:DUF4189 domain-containing protein [Pseudomonadota bacterium]